MIVRPSADAKVQISAKVYRIATYSCGKMICISCIIRATILRCDYPVLYVLRFYVVSTTILASIFRCDPTFAEICTLAFADGHTSMTSFPVR